MMLDNRLLEVLREIAREQSATDGAAAADKFQRIARDAIAAYGAEAQAEPLVLRELREGLGQVAVRVAEDPVMVRCCRLIDEVLATAAHWPQAGAASFDFRQHLQRQREWSERTFGPGARTTGVIDHIRKELLEIEADPSDVIEWIDVVILALDGAWRAGYSPEQIIGALVEKQAKNEGRSWPDWRTMPTDKAIEHDRSCDANESAPGLEAPRGLSAGEPAQHPDDVAVDAFAAAMKAKLAAARAKGRGGWQDKEDCSQQRLSDMLRAHVAKGDPRDVANFCMFLHQRGEAILPAEVAASAGASRSTEVAR
jgi:hypothetical protein